MKPKILISVLFCVTMGFAARIMDDFDDVAIDLPFVEENEPEYICKDSPVDISLIIDSSRSIYPIDFKRQIEFLVKFVTMFDISPTKVRVAAVSFGMDVIRQGSFYFNKYNSTKEVQGGLRGIKYRGREYGEGTNTALAIEYVRTKIFTRARPEAKKLCIVLTDGRSTDPMKTQEEAALIKQGDVEMVAIGIGNRISMKELNGIASSPDLVFTVESHSLLQTIKKKLILAICTDVEIVTVEPPFQKDDNKLQTITTPKTTTTIAIPIEYKTKHKTPITTTVSSPSNNNTTPTNKRKGCHGLLDINFVFNPVEIGARRVVKFIEKTITSKALANDDVRVGTITAPFADINGFRLNRYKSKADMKRHFDNFRLNRISPQLADLRLVSFLSINGGRAGARQIGVVFLRGELDDALEAVVEAKAAHFRGIDIYVISIGFGNRRIVVNNIATNAGNVFNVASSNDLPYLSKKFLQFMCQE